MQDTRDGVEDLITLRGETVVRGLPLHGCAIDEGAVGTKVSIQEGREDNSSLWRGMPALVLPRCKLGV